MRFQILQVLQLVHAKVGEQGDGAFKNLLVVDLLFAVRFFVRRFFLFILEVLNLSLHFEVLQTQLPGFLLACVQILHALFVNAVANLLVLVCKRVDLLSTVEHMIATMRHYEHFMTFVVQGKFEEPLHSATLQ
jgi:hypothetical protein